MCLLSYFADLGHTVIIIKANEDSDFRSSKSLRSDHRAILDGETGSEQAVANGENL